jgi:hypothetical protein
LNGYERSREGECGFDSCGSGYRPVSNFRDYNNKSWDSINCGDFLPLLKNSAREGGFSSMKKQNMKTVTQGCPFSLFATYSANSKQKLDAAHKELSSGHVCSVVVFLR